MPDPDFIPEIVVQDEDVQITQEIREVFTTNIAEAAAGASISLTELSAAFRAIPVRDLINERYLLGPAPRNWDYGSLNNNITRQLTPADFDAAAISYNPSDPHTPVLDDSNMYDEVHQETLGRWSRGSLNMDEIRAWNTSCPCVSCARALYEDVERQRARPPGYGATCQCRQCVGWRTSMAAGIVEAMRHGEVMTMRVDSSTMRPEFVSAVQNLDYDGALRQIGIDPIVARAARQTPFERQRQRRGHPVPVNPLAEGWSENKWEA